MLKRIFYPLLAFAAALCCSSLSAQDSGEETQTEIVLYKWSISNTIMLPDSTTGVSRRVKSDAGGNSELWYNSGGKWMSVTASPAQKSSRISYVGPRTMSFYKKIGPGEKSADFQEIAKLQIPAGAREIFALMFQKGSSIRFFPMNISPDSLPKGKIAVMNMTPQRIAISLSGDSKTLGPGSFTIFTPKKRSETSFDAKIAKFFNKKWVVIYESIMSVSSSERCAMLIYDPYGRPNNPQFSVQVLTF